MYSIQSFSKFVPWPCVFLYKCVGVSVYLGGLRLCDLLKELCASFLMYVTSSFMCCLLMSCVQMQKVQYFRLDKVSEISISECF